MSTRFNYDDAQPAIETAIAAAELKRSQGDIDGAYADYQAIVAQRIGAEYIAADLTALQSLADLAVLCGDFQAADDLLLNLKTICQEAGNQHRADFAILKRIHLALDRGQLRQASSLFDELPPHIGKIQNIDITPPGLLMWEAHCRWSNADAADRTVLFTHLYLEMGRLLSALGQYRDALEMLNRGLTHATPGDSQTVPVIARQLVPWFHLATSRALLESGLLTEAELALDALKVFLGSPQKRSLQIQWHTLAGKLDLLRGNFGEALEHFQVILDLCHQLKNQRGGVIASLNLAQVLIVLNQNYLAEEHLIGIANDVEQLDDPHLKTRLSLLKQLARSRSQSLVAGNTLSVSDLFNNHSPSASSLVNNDGFTFVRTRSPNYLTFFEDRVLEFQWYLSQSNLKDAAQMLADIQKIFANTDSQLIHLKIKTLQGLFAYYQGLHQVQSGEDNAGQQQIRWAVLALDEVRPQLADMELKPERWQVQRVLGWCLMRLNASTRDQEALAVETAGLLEELTHSLSPEQQVIFLLNKWTADEEYIATQIIQLRQLQQRLQKSPLHQRLVLWWQMLKRLNALMSHIDHYKDALAKRTIRGGKVDAAGQSSSLWTRLLKHPRQRATLSFLVLPDQIFVARNWLFWLDFTVVPTTRLELRNLVKRWYETLQARRNDRSISLYPEPDDSEEWAKPSPKTALISQMLAEKLSLPPLLATLPKRIRRLTIVPDDILHIFPFAAVRYREKYLVESFSLNITYESLRSNAAASTTQTDSQALLVGVSQGSAQFAALPGIMLELEKIYTWLTQQRLHPEILMNAEATKEAVLTALQSASLLHIACHGIFHPNRPDQSGLVLDPTQSPPEVLSLREISNLNLESLHHVTLSACSSADHLVLPGRWVIGLPETLWRVGVPSILGSLWQVHDQLAIAFMARFYTYLQTLPRDEAIRQTQLDCLHQKIQVPGIVDTSDPVYWAGFNLYGSYEPLFRNSLLHRLRQKRPNSLENGDAAL